MHIHHFSKLFLGFIAASFFLTQTSFGYLNHVDVLAKIIPMADGSEKVDVAVIGSDLHRYGSQESDWQLLFDLAERLDLKENTVEIFVEAVAAPSYFREIPNSVIQYINAAKLNFFNPRLNTFTPGLSPLGAFLLLDSTYEKINKFFKKNIEWDTFFNQVKVTNLETRATFDFSQSAALSPDIRIALLNLFSELWSTKNLNKMVVYLEQWEKESSDKQLKQIFKHMNKQCNILLNRLKNTVKKYFAHLNANAKNISSDEIISNIIKNVKNSKAYNNPDEALQEAIFLQKKIFLCLEYVDIIQAKALWHISQPETRASNRTITLMGAYHANKSAVPAEIIDGVRDQYAKTKPHFHQDRSLVACLEKIGYTHLDSITFDYEILKRTRQNYNTQKPVDSQDIEAMNDFAAQVSDFVLKWVHISDDDVRSMLATTDEN